MSKHGGLLGFLSEALEIQRELGVSAEESHAIQRERSDARLAAALEMEQAAAESNVIPFRGKH